MAYVPPTEPTGPPPAHLIAMDINQLLDTLRTNADALLVDGRMTVGPNLININNDIKHIIRMIITHIIQVEDRANRAREELDTSTGLLRYLQEQNTATGREIHGIRQRLIACQNEKYGIQNERNGLLNERNGLLNERNRLLNERNNLGMAGNAGANCPVATWVAGTGAQAHMTGGAPLAGVANLVTDVWPDYALEGNRNIWLNRAGMEFTNDPLNHNVVCAAAGAGAGAIIPGGAVNQFLRGLNDDCAIKAERIGTERDIEELVGLLEWVGKRKAELRIGKER
ncbi:hypothetical protein RCL_jg11251.t1 [Rhizophagus clarus]|uniref:Uncharacterized protein n=1 Tax=Rhizophagus clarus TaxID=94130 RepID=A0A8H3LL84_9GLOM|nr:hypothetical protein RCL_jg11251.t1 [Rhizophagus clarus]